MSAGKPSIFVRIVVPGIIIILTVGMIFYVLTLESNRASAPNNSVGIDTLSKDIVWFGALLLFGLFFIVGPLYLGKELVEDISMRFLFALHVLKACTFCTSLRELSIPYLVNGECTKCHTKLCRECFFYIDKEQKPSVGCPNCRGRSFRPDKSLGYRFPLFQRFGGGILCFGLILIIFVLLFLMIFWLPYLMDTLVLLVGGDVLNAPLFVGNHHICMSIHGLGLRAVQGLHSARGKK